MKHILFYTIILYSIHGWSQEYKLGKVNIAELEEKQCPIDTTAPAAIIYSERESYIDLDCKYGIVLKDVYFKRIKIYNREGFNYATHVIQLYHDGDDSEEVSDIKAFTYNLQENKIVKTKLQSSDVYKEKSSEHIKSVKYTMPDIKPGSVIEWQYTVSTPFLHYIDEIVFQEDIPVKKVYANFRFPNGFSFRYFSKGSVDFDIKESHKKRLIKGCFFGDDSTWDVIENIFEITQKNVPALTEEPYSGNIDNYRRSMKFELISINMHNYKKKYSITWEDVAKFTFKNPKFGKQLKKKRYLKKDLNGILEAIPDKKQRINLIIKLAKRKIKWNGKYSYLTKDGVAKAYNNGSGNVAEVNLNLINMLNYCGIDAYPVLVSTVDHGIPLFPTINGFNYIIAAIPTQKGYDLLDATDSNSAVNLLPLRDLNFVGRLIEKDGSSKEIDLFPKVFTRKLVTVNTTFDGTDFSGISINKMDNYFAYNFRKSLRGLKKNEQRKYLEDKYNNLEITKQRIKNLDNPNSPIVETIQFETDSYSESIGDNIYITPLLFLSMGKNPFDMEKRQFPVFFNYPKIIIKKVSIKIPDDYKIISLPKDTEISFGEHSGHYTYKITSTENTINITSSYAFNLSIVDVDQYKELKQFFDNIISKQSETIVIQKK